MQGTKFQQEPPAEVQGRAEFCFIIRVVPIKSLWRSKMNQDSPELVAFSYPDRDKIASPWVILCL